MNLKLYNKLMVKGSGPRQNKHEWQVFLENCEAHLKKHKIENPVAVELGLFKGRQKKFYEQLLGAEHIGININNKHTTPDIIGNTHDPKTLKALKRRLGKRPINILFIDASHTYNSVKKDFQIYSPLCSDIVAFHDIGNSRNENYKDDKDDGVWRFWDELNALEREGADEYKDFSFISIREEENFMGIGMIIKR